MVDWRIHYATCRICFLSIFYYYYVSSDKIVLVYLIWNKNLLIFDVWWHTHTHRTVETKKKCLVFFSGCTICSILSSKTNTCLTVLLSFDSGIMCEAFTHTNTHTHTHTHFILSHTLSHTNTHTHIWIVCLTQNEYTRPSVCFIFRHISAICYIRIIVSMCERKDGLDHYYYSSITFYPNVRCTSSISV